MSGTFLRTLHLETGRHLYGGPRQVLLLLEGSQEARHRGHPRLPHRQRHRRSRRDGRPPGDLHTHPIGGDLDISAVTFLARTVQRLKPDLLHAHSRRGADYFGGLAAALARVPAVLTRRVDNPDTPVIGALKYRAYDRIVAISAAIRAPQLERQGLPATKLRTIRSAVDADACQPTWTDEKFRREFGLAPGQRSVAVVAQLIPRKGHALLLQAWPRIRVACRDARLLIFGTGPLQAELAGTAGPGDSVTFAGFRPDLLEFLGRVDLLVHPASREGLGVGLLEAQAAGVPVVAVAAGGIPEAVSDGATGILVPPGDPAAHGRHCRRRHCIAGASRPAPGPRCRRRGPHPDRVPSGPDGGVLHRAVPGGAPMTDDNLMAARVAELAELLSARGLKLSTAESCTGGWLAKLLTDRPGSSAWFEFGFVTYGNNAKHALLGVPEQTLGDHGAVSRAGRRGNGDRRPAGQRRGSGGGDHRHRRAGGRHGRQARRHGLARLGRPRRSARCGTARVPGRPRGDPQPGGRRRARRDDRPAAALVRVRWPASGGPRQVMRCSCWMVCSICLSMPTRRC